MDADDLNLRLIELVSQSRREGWYEEDSRWKEVEDLLTAISPHWDNKDF